jgi:hypothetical protein
MRRPKEMVVLPNKEEEERRNHAVGVEGRLHTFSNLSFCTSIVQCFDAAIANPRKVLSDPKKLFFCVIRHRGIVVCNLSVIAFLHKSLTR